LSSDNIRRVEDTTVSADIRNVYRQAVVIALVGNVALLALKAVAAYLSGSAALYADAANSAADLAYSLLMLVGLWLSLQPPDAGHPHGHQRIEPLVSIGIAAAMALAGYEALTNGIAAWRLGEHVELSIWYVAVPVATILAKMGMYRRVRSLAERVSSPAIAASARDHLSDTLTSGVVLLGLVGYRIALPQADPVAGVLVSLWIFYQVLGVVREAIGHLIGAAASPAVQAAATAAILGVPEVIAVEKLIIEHVGPEFRADIHVIVDGDMPLRRVHRVSHAIREAVEGLDGVDHAFVHVEPDVLDHDF
jgi:cation diffusion facilitator family transporter